MFVIYEADKLVLETTEIREVTDYIAAQGFQFVLDVLGTKVFDNPDGRTAAVRVVEK